MSEQDGTVHEYYLTRGEQNHIMAKIGEEITIGFRLYAPDDQDFQRGQRAYVQYDILTELGPLRGRNLKVVSRRHDGQLTVRWPQFPTGRKRALREGGEIKPEFLDTIGPRDANTRRVWAEKILDVYRQIMAEAEAGTLPAQGRNRSRRPSQSAQAPPTTIGQANPRVAAHLERLAAATIEGEPDEEEQATAGAQEE
jgi:hypothetical protein